MKVKSPIEEIFKKVTPLLQIRTRGGLVKLRQEEFALATQCFRSLLPFLLLSNFTPSVCRCPLTVICVVENASQFAGLLNDRARFVFVLGQMKIRPFSGNRDEFSYTA